VSDLLVTGAGGFLGSHLTKELSSHGHRVVGVDFGAPPDSGFTRWIPLAQPTDLSGAVERALTDGAITTVLHCAFVNRKPAGESDEVYLQGAVSRDLPLFRVCAERGVQVVLVSSSAVYGALSFDDRPIREEDPMRPVTLYGVAKAVQELEVSFLAASLGLRVAIARLFNLCGPGQKEGMLIPDWVSRVAAIEAGAEPRLVVRNRATTRDFVDVRDAARALRLMTESFVPGELANVASGTAVSLTDLSDALQALSAVPYDVIETDPVPSGTDPVVHCGSFARLERRYGWRPTISWRQSLGDVWQQYRNART